MKVTAAVCSGKALLLMFSMGRRVQPQARYDLLEINTSLVNRL